MKGGYYSHDFADTELTLLALNSMYFKTDNNCSLEVGHSQLDWLERVLQKNSLLPKQEQREFVLSMHVFPGLNYFSGWVEVFWRDEFT